MTPYLFKIACQGWTDSIERSDKQFIAGAWYTEAFHRTKKLPDLEKLVKHTSKDKSEADAIKEIMYNVARVVENGS